MLVSRVSFEGPSGAGRECYSDIARLTFEAGSASYKWPSSEISLEEALVKMQCQRLDVAIPWPKSCVISLFLSMEASCVTENMISLKNWSEAVPLMTSYLCDLN